MGQSCVMTPSCKHTVTRPEKGLEGHSPVGTKLGSGTCQRVSSHSSPLSGAAAFAVGFWLEVLTPQGHVVESLSVLYSVAQTRQICSNAADAILASRSVWPSPGHLRQGLLAKALGETFLSIGHHISTVWQRTVKPSRGRPVAK